MYSSAPAWPHLAYPESSQRTFLSDHCYDSLYSPSQDMFQVFSAEAPNESSFPTHIVPATFTFQLGPQSLDQIDDPDASALSHYDDEAWDGKPAVDSSFRRASPDPFDDQSSKKILDKHLTTKLVRSANTKRSKMHQCHLCLKWFPRPSGLATHMNSHSGLRPFSCPLSTCNKTFAVRSNAKRHLRTHGIIPDPEPSHKSNKYTVGFDTPLVSQVHEMSELPPRLRWVPQSLISRMDVDWSRSTDSESDDDTCPTLPVPLHPSVSPVSWDSSYGGTALCNDPASQPYHPRHWRGLPGPALRQLVL